MSPSASLILFLLAGSLIAWIAIVLTTARLLTHPPRRGYAAAVSRGRPGDPSELPHPRAFSSWMLHCDETRSTHPAWTIEGDDPAGPAIAFSHGWGESKQGVLSRLAALAPIASRIIAWDLPGHGESSRGPSHLGTREHIALAALLRRGVEPGTPVVLHGFSLGAGASLACARAGDIAGVILEAPYRFARTPAHAVMRARGLPILGVLTPALLLASARRCPGLLSMAFDRREIARAAPCPILVLHGERDSISPIEDGRAIADACTNPESRISMVPGAGHNDLWTTPENFARSAEAIRAFLDDLQAGVSRVRRGADSGR